MKTQEVIHEIIQGSEYLLEIWIYLHCTVIILGMFRTLKSPCYEYISLIIIIFFKSTFEQGLGAISTILNDHTHTLADC